MQNFILDATWTATAGCVLGFCIILAMATGGGTMWILLKGYYFLKVQQENMQQNAETEIGNMKKQSEADRENAKIERMARQ